MYNEEHIYFNYSEYKFKKGGIYTFNIGQYNSEHYNSVIFASFGEYEKSKIS